MIYWDFSNTYILLIHQSPAKNAHGEQYTPWIQMNYYVKNMGAWVSMVSYSKKVNENQNMKKTKKI